MHPAALEPFVHRVEDEWHILVIDAEVALHAFRYFIPTATLMEL